MRDLAEKHSPNFWKYLTSCMQCLPFWVGIFVSFATITPIEVDNEYFPFFLNRFSTYLFSGALFSGTTLFIHNLFISIKGKHWDEMQEKEKLRKVKKGIIPKKQEQS